MTLPKRLPDYLVSLSIICMVVCLCYWLLFVYDLECGLVLQYRYVEAHCVCPNFTDYYASHTLPDVHHISNASENPVYSFISVPLQSQTNI